MNAAPLLDAVENELSEACSRARRGGMQISWLLAAVAASASRLFVRTRFPVEVGGGDNHWCYSTGSGSIMFFNNSIPALVYFIQKDLILS